MLQGSLDWKNEEAQQLKKQIQRLESVMKKHEEEVIAINITG
jgi:hypothetical protein